MHRLRQMPRRQLFRFTASAFIPVGGSPVALVFLCSIRAPFATIFQTLLRHAVGGNHCIVCYLLSHDAGTIIKALPVLSRCRESVIFARLKLDDYMLLFFVVGAIIKITTTSFLLFGFRKNLKTGSINACKDLFICDALSGLGKN